DRADRVAVLLGSGGRAAGGEQRADSSRGVARARRLVEGGARRVVVAVDLAGVEAARERHPGPRRVVELAREAGGALEVDPRVLAATLPLREGRLLDRQP